MHVIISLSLFLKSIHSSSSSSFWCNSARASVRHCNLTGARRPWPNRIVKIPLPFSTLIACFYCCLHLLFSNFHIDQYAFLFLWPFSTYLCFLCRKSHL